MEVQALLNISEIKITPTAVMGVLQHTSVLEIKHKATVATAAAAAKESEISFTSIVATALQAPVKKSEIRLTAIDLIAYDC